MGAWRYQRGGISPGCIVGVVVLLITVLIAIKAIPVMIKVYDFQDEVVSLSEKGATLRYRNKPEKMAIRLKERADELGLPISADAIKVVFTKKMVHITVEYEVEIVFPGYTYTWHKLHDEERPIW